MKRYGLLRGAVPASVLLLLAAACGGTSGGDLFGGDGDAGLGDASSDTSSDANGNADVCVDADGDGQSTCAGDCNDDDRDVFTGNTEICGDAKDNNCNGQIEEGCGGLGTYVSRSTGLDTNPGTKALPVKTIAKGIANAVTIGGARTVYVAGGHYPEKVTLVEGKSLAGGYLCNATTCDWSRNAATNDTAIDNQDGEGVLAGATITKGTRVDGFRLRGQVLVAASSACMTLDGASPTLTNNRFVGADVSGGPNGRSIGIQIFAPTADATGALIDRNTITGGATVGGVSLGITFEGKPGSPAPTVPAVAVVSNNNIQTGAGVTSIGISGNTAGGVTSIVKNDVTAGAASGNFGAFTGAGWGILVRSSSGSYPATVVIDSNRVNANQATVGVSTSANFCGGIASFGSTATITNNIVFGVKGPQSAAVYLADGEAAVGAVVLNGNYLDGAGVGIAVTKTVSAALVQRINGGVGAILGRTRNNIMMGGINQFRYGVWEEQTAAKTCHPAAFQYNDLFFNPPAGSGGRTDFLYHHWDGSTATDLATAVAITAKIPTYDNLISADPLSNATFHIAKVSPCHNAGTATEAPAKDFEGDPRIAPFDIGNDEVP